MRMSDILRPEFTVCSLEAGSKKRLLQFAADFFAEKLETISAPTLYDALIARERLGSTAIGHGAAIPHCRLEGLDNAQVALFRLAEPIPFDAPDGRPVQIVFILLVPAEATEDHLQILRLLARSLDSQEYRIGLHEADSNAALHKFAVTRAAEPETDPGPGPV